MAGISDVASNAGPALPQPCACMDSFMKWPMWRFRAPIHRWESSSAWVNGKIKIPANDRFIDNSNGKAPKFESQGDPGLSTIRQ